MNFDAIPEIIVVRASREKNDDGGGWDYVRVSDTTSSPTGFGKTTRLECVKNLSSLPIECTTSR